MLHQTPKTHPGATLTPNPGPRPLPLHLMTAASLMTSLPAGLQMWNAGWLTLNPKAVRGWGDASFAALTPEILTAAATAQMDLFLRGVEAYRAHPARREETPTTIVHEIGTTKLRKFGESGQKSGQQSGSQSGPPVLLIPSLINRYGILDLHPDKSLVRTLQAAGFCPHIVDWDTPGDTESTFTLTDYIHRLLQILEEIETPLPVIGYCMGGTFALALSVLAPEKVKSLVLLASPWDFHVGRWREMFTPDTLAAVSATLNTSPNSASTASLNNSLNHCLADANLVPVETLQTLFATLDPFGVLDKFRAFATWDQTSAKARDFVLAEHWLNDGVPLSKNVLTETLNRWYGANDLAAGNWCLNGTSIAPKHVECPTLLIHPVRDKIVPPASSAALPQMIRHITTHHPVTGHIGMMAGGQAIQNTYAPVVEFLKD